MKTYRATDRIPEGYYVTNGVLIRPSDGAAIANARTRVWVRGDGTFREWSGASESRRLDDPTFARMTFTGPYTKEELLATIP